MGEGSVAWLINHGAYQYTANNKPYYQGFHMIPQKEVAEQAPKMNDCSTSVSLSLSHSHSGGVGGITVRTAELSAVF